MTAPRTDAHALHDLLQGVLDQGTAGVGQAWAAVLDCEVNSAEFARRHSEVASLLRNTLAQIEALDDTVRSRYLKYAHAWWSMIVAPSHAWPKQAAMSSLVNQNHLDHLAGAADIIAARTNNLVSPNDDQLANLRNECKQWIEEVSQFAELPHGLRLTLQHDLQHVVWLIDNVHLFGVGRVSASAEQVAGGLAVASRRVVGEEHRKTWKQRATELTIAIGVVTGIMSATDLALETGQNLGETVISIMPGDDEPPPRPRQGGSAN